MLAGLNLLFEKCLFPSVKICITYGSLLERVSQFVIYLAIRTRLDGNISNIDDDDPGSKTEPVKSIV